MLLYLSTKRKSYWVAMFAQHFSNFSLDNWVGTLRYTLKSRPCGFGQSLGRPIVRSISHFFWSTKEKFVQYQIFFVHSLEFFVQSFLKMWFWSVSWSTNCPVYFSFFWSTKKKFVQSQIFFVHSFEFFVQSFMKMTG